MNHYFVFLLGMMVGAFFGIFVLGLCQMARENYFYPEEQYNPPTKKEKQTSEYLLERGI
jgi:hypothetical protein